MLPIKKLLKIMTVTEVPTLEFDDQTLVLKFGRYSNNAISISLETMEMEPYMCATVFIPEFEYSPYDVTIKNYSENEGILEALANQGYIKYSWARIPLGYSQVNGCVLTEKSLNYIKQRQL